jgi:hypothetical protein
LDHDWGFCGKDYCKQLRKKNIALVYDSKLVGIEDESGEDKITAVFAAAIATVNLLASA